MCDILFVEEYILKYFCVKCIAFEEYIVYVQCIVWFGALMKLRYQVTLYSFASYIYKIIIYFFSVRETFLIVVVGVWC